MKRYLVALDGSERAPLVLAAAADLARKTDAKLELLRVVGLPPEMPREVWKLDEALLLENLKTQAYTEMTKLAEARAGELVAASRIEVGGPPWRAICDIARIAKADLVVIGSHGYGGLDRVLGTTAAKVVNHAECSVLVVR